MKNRQCFLHDSHAASDRKMLRILEVSGPEGYGIVWLIVERMRQEENLTFSLCDVPMYARIWNTTEGKIIGVINAACGVGLFEDPEGLENTEYITAPALRRDIEQLKEKQEKWRNEKRGKKDSEKKVDGKENFSGSEKEEVRTLEHRTKKKEKRTKNTEPRNCDEMETLGKEPHGESGDVWLTPTEHERLKTKFGETFAARCIEKLDAWISQKRTPDRIINGQNAAATLRSWVINAVTEEQAKAEKIQGNGPLKPHQIMSTQQRTAMETIKFFEEREKNANK